MDAVAGQENLELPAVRTVSGARFRSGVSDLSRVSRQMFKGQRGAQATENFFNLSNTFERLRFSGI